MLKTLLKADSDLPYSVLNRRAPHDGANAFDGARMAEALNGQFDFLAELQLGHDYQASAGFGNVEQLAGNVAAQSHGALQTLDLDAPTRKDPPFKAAIPGMRRSFWHLTPRASKFGISSLALLLRLVKRTCGLCWLTLVEGR